MAVEEIAQLFPQLEILELLGQGGMGAVYKARQRDIKPENILLDSKGRVKIADFGLAKIRTTEEDASQITRTHQVMGTPSYMAPEQWKQTTSVDHRADIFSLGVVFYELLTGELPIGRFPVPSETVQVDVRLDNVVLKALEQDPKRRYQHASQVKEDITDTTSHEIPDAKQTPPAEPQSPTHFDPFNPYWEGYLSRFAQTKFAEIREKVRSAYGRCQFGLRT